MQEDPDVRFVFSQGLWPCKAAVRGFVFGSGYELPLAGDLRVIAINAYLCVP